MNWIGRIILKILANAIGIAIAVFLVPQINFDGSLIDYLIVGVILTVANLIVRPILKLISAPLVFITAGLFTIVINGIILFGVDFFIEELIISGFWGYLWGIIIISIINAIMNKSSKKKKF